MAKARLARVLAILAACAALGVVLATVVFTGSRASADAPSPSCIPAATSHDATLAGTGFDVSPAPGTDTANPDTQISFLGAPAAQIREVSVTGARSGHHEGRLAPYSQGDGASFLPQRPFQQGERVSVRATLGAGAGTPVQWSFRVDTPYPTQGVPPFPNPAALPSEYQSFRTLAGAQPPVLTVTRRDRDLAAGEIFTTNGPGPGAYGPLIYSPQGRLVWFDQLTGGTTAEDLNVQSYEGRPALTFWRGKVLNLGFGQGEDVVLNNHYQVLARVTGGNGLRADLHEFQLAPNGVAYLTAYNPIRCDLSSMQGARNGSILDTAIQEIDMRTGLVRWEWHSLDHVAVRDSEVEASKNTTPWDWFHLNSIDVQPNGDLLISARNTWAAYELERGSGNVLWRLGGSDSSFKLGPGAETAWQHDGRMLPDGTLTFFDDGSNPPVHHQSRGVRIVLDRARNEARLAAVYKNPHRLLSASQGNMQTLPDGDVLLGYGGVPEISEYAPNGALLFDAHLPYGMTFYRAFRYPWNGRPLYPPTALASLNNTGEETIVHMSWNGATGVSAWRILAGDSRPTQGATGATSATGATGVTAAPHATSGAPPGGGALARRMTVRDSGFESSAVLPKRFSYVAVQALGPHGQVLGTSATVAVASYEASFGGAK
jgi:hypothetical protein